MGKQIRVSDAAYSKIKDIAQDEKYKDKGCVGVLDMLLLGHFTTKESGRPKKSKKPKKSC